MSKWRIRLAVFGAVLGAGASLLSDRAALADEPAPEPIDCGTGSLFLLLRLNDRPAGLAEIEGALPTRDPRGHSMAELADASRALGLDLEGVALGNADRLPDRPAIAFLDRGGEDHFVVLRPVGTTGTMIQVLDPPRTPRIADVATLRGEPQWSGRLLVLASRLGWSAPNLMIAASVIGFVALGVAMFRRTVLGRLLRPGTAAER